MLILPRLRIDVLHCGVVSSTASSVSTSLASFVIEDNLKTPVIRLGQVLIFHSPVALLAEDDVAAYLPVLPPFLSVTHQSLPLLHASLSPALPTGIACLPQL